MIYDGSAEDCKQRVKKPRRRKSRCTMLQFNKRVTPSNDSIPTMADSSPDDEFAAQYVESGDDIHNTMDHYEEEADNTGDDTGAEHDTRTVMPQMRRPPRVVCEMMAWKHFILMLFHYALIVSRYDVKAQ